MMETGNVLLEPLIAKHLPPCSEQLDALMKQDGVFDKS